MVSRNRSREMGIQDVRAEVVVYSLDLRSWAKVMDREKERAGSRSRNHKENGYLNLIAKDDDAVDATAMAKLNEDGLVPYRVGNRRVILCIIRAVIP